MAAMFMTTDGGNRDGRNPGGLHGARPFSIQPCFTTALGALYAGDCVDILRKIPDDSVDTVFADPPFNLKKRYGANCTDDMAEAAYVSWCREWIVECYRVLKPGGSFFLYNIPRWNLILGSYMIELGLTFRHSIAVEMKTSMPIRGRLYPAHYSLLYFSNGKPATFRKIRTPVETCRHCGGDIRDYGGHRKALNPNGLNLKDVWTDIPPVRHRKFMAKGRNANALSTKLLDRVIEISTVAGEVVLDPFGGSGTTFAVCEKKGRHWIGIELDFCQAIIDRLTSGDVEHHANDDHVAQ
jgi:site-specific DNA-methyltransferase (adenine-specific)